MRVVMMMLMKSAPLTLRAMRMPLSRIPMMPSTETWVNAPRLTKVSGLDTMMLAFLRPMKAMNMPMPTEIARRRLMGMALRIYSLSLMTVMRMKITPSTSEMASACCHE